MASKSVVSITRYEKPLDSVRRAIELCKGLDHLPSNARVFVKPNIVFWTSAVPFPKWGAITTSRIVEDIIILLKEKGIDKITVGEGTVTLNPKNKETALHAFETLGYNKLKKRYGIKVVNIFERPFKKVNLGAGVELNFNTDILQSDFVINLPVLKTHAQTIVSLGIKNIKGTIDIPSRKKCHSVNSGKDLNFMIAKLSNVLAPHFTLLDGIFTLERGPGFDGTARRSNLLIGSANILSADMVGAKVLGYDPSEVPHLVHASEAQNRLTDMSDVEVVGEKIEEVAAHHEYSFPFNEKEELPLPFEAMGIRGLSYRKYDLTICTYCSQMNSIILPAIAMAWKGKPWDNIEILTGKVMKPTPGRKKVVLVGKCIYEANKDNPNIENMIAVKGCPPSPKGICKALRNAGIDVDPTFFDRIDKYPKRLLRKYNDKPEFEESFYRVY